MKLAIIGGSGLMAVEGFRLLREHSVATSYGAPSATIGEGVIEGASPGTYCYFLPRHGAGRHIPPHAVNYRANIAALAELGATHIVTVNIVGGINSMMAPNRWVVPDQLIDYTWGRAHSCYDGSQPVTGHVVFDPPFDAALSARLYRAASAGGLPVQRGATYGCTQGPRLETAAEIRRLARDGCDIVGMTAMPEAALARECGIPYAALCLVVNWAAGIGDQLATVADMQGVVAAQMPAVMAVLATLCDVPGD